MSHIYGKLKHFNVTCNIHSKSQNAFCKATPAKVNLYIFDKHTREHTINTSNDNLTNLRNNLWKSKTSAKIFHFLYKYYIFKTGKKQILYQCQKIIFVLRALKIRFKSSIVQQISQKMFHGRARPQHTETRDMN